MILQNCVRAYRLLIKTSSTVLVAWDRIDHVALFATNIDFVDRRQARNAAMRITFIISNISPRVSKGVPNYVSFPKSALFNGWSSGSTPPFNTRFLKPTRVLIPNGISIRLGLSVFAGLTNVTNRPKNRQTDHATSVLGSNRPHHLLCIATRPNNNVNATVNHSGHNR